MDVEALAQLLHETADHHDPYEKSHAPHDWWDWYAAYMIARQSGSTRTRQPLRRAGTWRRSSTLLLCDIPLSDPVTGAETRSDDAHRHRPAGWPARRRRAGNTRPGSARPRLRPRRSTSLRRPAIPPSRRPTGGARARHSAESIIQTGPLGSLPARERDGRLSLIGWRVVRPPCNPAFRPVRVPTVVAGGGDGRAALVLEWVGRRAVRGLGLEHSLGLAQDLALFPVDRRELGSISISAWTSTVPTPIRANHFRSAGSRTRAPIPCSCA